MTTRFRAAVLRSYEKPFTVEEVALHEEPADGEILVGSRAAGCAGPTSRSVVRQAGHRSRPCSVTRARGSWWGQAARTPA